MKERLSPTEMLERIRRLMKISPYPYDEKGWFFPSDLIPFSSQLKYQCGKLHSLGLLDRSSDPGRWGYQYRIK